ncbi:TIGR03663 family protein [Archaeoglobales archaeon]|nr:MAG: TIGR03663 family protein [Archaeoglobales archaeon]
MKSKLIILVILTIALVTRIVILDARPIDHDEGIHAYLSYKLLKYGSYRYDPTYHGPFLYFATAALFYLFGDSESVTRLTPIIFSIVGVFVAYNFRRWMGNGGYIFTFLMLFSTSILYYSRYMRNDIILVASFLVVLYCYFRFVESKKERFVYTAAAFLAIMFTSKENAYIYTFILFSFLILYGLHKEGFRYFINKILNWDVRKVKTMFISATIFSLIFVILYSAFFADMHGVERAVIGSISHWFEMHKIQDHAKPWYYYPGLIIKYEFLPLALSIASIPSLYNRIKSKNVSRIELFAGYWVVTSLVIYQILSHKVPWLLVHLATPLSFFGSIYMGGKLHSKHFKLAFGIVTAATLITSCYITYFDYNNAREELIYIQIQPPTVELAKEIQERLKTQKGVIYEPKNDYWPLPWYLRYVKISYLTKGDISKYNFVVTSEREVDYCKSLGFKIVKKYELRPWVYLVLMEKAK